MLSNGLSISQISRQTECSRKLVQNCRKQYNITDNGGLRGCIKKNKPLVSKRN